MNSTIKCSNCKTEIADVFCPHCGQKYIRRGLKIREIVEDYWDNLLSLDISLWLNIKYLILNPGFIVHNYWRGFRNFFISPNKLLVISAFFLGINLVISNNSFLGINITAKNFSAQIGFLIIIIPLLTISSYIAYLKHKQSLLEHLVLNMYSLGVWLIIFSTVSLVVYYFKLQFLRTPLLLLFLILIFIWNSRSFNTKILSRIISFIINIAIFGLIIVGMVYLIILAKSTSAQ